MFLLGNALAAGHTRPLFIRVAADPTSSERRHIPTVEGLTPKKIRRNLIRLQDLLWMALGAGLVVEDVEVAHFYQTVQLRWLAGSHNQGYVSSAAVILVLIKYVINTKVGLELSGSRHNFISFSPEKPVPVPGALQTLAPETALSAPRPAPGRLGVLGGDDGVGLQSPAPTPE